MIPQFSYVKASSLDEAVKHAANQQARIHAGGTDLLGCLRDGVFGADTVVRPADRSAHNHRGACSKPGHCQVVHRAGSGRI
jgi:hypothetical protein